MGQHGSTHVHLALSTRPSREGRSNMGHMGNFSLRFLLDSHVDTRVPTFPVRHVTRPKSRPVTMHVFCQNFEKYHFLNLIK